MNARNGFFTQRIFYHSKSVSSIDFDRTTQRLAATTRETALF